MNKRWVIASPEPALVATLSRGLRIPPALAQALINRGHRDVQSAREFLNPQLRRLRDPFALPDMAAAVDRVFLAMRKRQRIVLYGDYDVDGVTSCALLVRVLRSAGASVETFVPHRMDEGYGLTEDGIARCLKEHEPELLVAVDCGTGSVREIADLKREGIDTIVLDHHEPTAQLPECVALINPKVVGRVTSRGAAPDAVSGDTAYKDPLASVGVSFKLAHAMLKRDRGLAEKVDLRDHLDLVAIGTVADVVPLTGENRILVKAGLERLAASDKVGLRALMDIADVPDEVNPYHIGFRIGPRLNAAGRLGDAMAALDLLLTDDRARAAELAKLLNDHNTDRQHVEEKIVEEALTMAAEFEGDRVLVLAKEGWHIGVIGIVASRVLQEFYRPTVIIGIENGLGKGSCRSISGFSIVAALEDCAGLLERFGGHEMAAGLSVKASKIPQFRRALNEFAAKVLHAEDLRPRLTVDAAVKLADLNEAFFDGLQGFEPCGQDNPTPVFAVEGVTTRGPARVVGKDHLKFFVTDPDAGVGVEAIWFRAGDRRLPKGRFDLAFTPEINTYRGVETVQLRVKDARPAAT